MSNGMDTLKGNIPGSLVFGAPGKSAYQLAVENGYEGTVLQWLASLRGLAGKTAYEYAKDGGYTGTEDEFAEKLATILQRLDDLEQEEPGATIEVDATLTVEGKAADAKAVGDKLAAIPVTVSEDGYTDITGLRQIIGGSVVKDGNTITVTTTLQGDEIHTDVITLNDDGYPSVIVSDGIEAPWSWEGFEDVALQVWEGGSY